MLPEECYKHVRNLVDCGAIVNVKEDLFRSVGDLVIEVTCPDCHQRKGWRDYLERFFTLRHPLMLNGGAVLIPEDSPLNIDGEEGRVFIRHIKKTIDLKKITVIILSVHAPCGVVREISMPMDQKLEFLLKAADRVRAAIPNATVVKLFHVNYGQSEDREKSGTKTYVLKREPFQAYINQQLRQSA